MAESRYLSVEEVAEHFGVTPATVYRLAQRGVLPGFKLGVQWRFSQKMLELWVADQVTVKSRPAQGSHRKRRQERGALAGMDSVVGRDARSRAR